MPHAPPIVGRYGKRPHSRMRRLQLRTVRDLIGSPRAFAGRAAPKERLVDSAGVPAPRLSRMRRLQLRTVRDLIGSPRAFAGRAAPKERLVDSAGVPAPRLTARGPQALLRVG